MRLYGDKYNLRYYVRQPLITGLESSPRVRRSRLPVSASIILRNGTHLTKQWEEVLDVQISLPFFCGRKLQHHCHGFLCAQLVEPFRKQAKGSIVRAKMVDGFIEPWADDEFLEM